MKNGIRWFVFLFLLGWTPACVDKGSAESSGQEPAVAVENPAPSDEPERPSALANGKFFEKGGRKYLCGGEKEGQHFDSVLFRTT